MRACIFIVAALTSQVLVNADLVKAKDSPVQQVVGLLRGLINKVEVDGKAEAESYDKFACFCKEQADEKQYHIEKSLKKVDEESATSQQLASQITSNNRDIGQLNTKISDITTTLKDEMEIRKKQHAEYTSMDNEMTSAIDDIRTAIDTLRESRPSAMVQVKNVATHVLEHHASLVPTSEEKDLLKSLSLFGNAGKPHAYEFRSNDIIATLQGLAKNFVSNKEDLDHEEFEANSAYEHRKLSLEQRRDIARKEKMEKEQEVEKDTQAKEAADEIVTTQTAAKEADVKFIQELQADCETKARDYDQRTKVRSDELVALNSAIQTLITDVVPISLMQHSAKPKALSFLQVRTAKPMERVLELVTTSSTKLHSSALTLLAAKIKSNEDHFVKVRKLVKDLIARLEQNAAFEQNVKTFCDKQMEKSIAERDQAQMSVEEYIAKLRALEAQDQKLRGDIASDNAAIAADEKALQEATELRTGEHGENTEAIETAKGGKEAVKYALSVLKEFYESQGTAPALIQQPSNADRNGETVDELAPTTFSGHYHGAQQSSQSIIGLLETILADFERSESTTSDNENDAQSDYTQQRDDILTDERNINKELDSETNRDQSVINDIAETSDDELSAEQQLKQAIKAAGGVKELCADGAESYEDKKAAREKEIESLKEAIQILDSMED